MADNDTEIGVAALALERAQGKSVRDFAGRLVRDHGGLNQRLAVFASSRSLALVPRPADEGAIESLGAVDGAAFDGQFLRWSIVAHQKSLSSLNEIMPRTSDGKLKALVQSAMSMAVDHLSTAEDLSSRSGAGGGR